MKRLVVTWALVRGALRATHEPAPEEADDGVDPRRYDVGAPAWAERATAILLALTGLLALAFAVLVGAHPDTQLLGVAGGGALACLAAALILAGLRVVPQETAVEDRPPVADPEAVEEDERLLARAADGVSRRKLLLGGAGVAGAGLVAGSALPVTALGPSPRGLDAGRWHAGVALVDEDDGPVRTADLEIGSFVTAFPRGADKRELGSPVIVVRVEPAMLRLPPARRDWAPLGILAFSKICTHAGCAVSLFRYPTYEPRSSAPALVCPCHYSTFDVLRAARVEFGPAGRPLPQLPLRIDGGALVAAGPLSGTVGPAWWGTRR